MRDVKSMSANVVRDLPLSTRQVAEQLGIAPATWRVWVHRGQAPAADDHFDGRTPFWWQSTIDAYKTSTNVVLAEPIGR